jgi:excinuclease ABC subunit B
MTESIKQLLAITKDRREKQLAYNREHNITPRSVIRAVQESLGNLLKGRQLAGSVVGESSPDMDVMQVLQELETEMLAASNSMHYEKAALLRDQIMELKQQAGLTKIEPKAKPTPYPKSRGGRKLAKKI